MDANYAAPEATAPDAITAAARTVAETVDASAIVTYTQSGATALRAARERPEQPILALIPNEDVARRLALVWGVRCIHGQDAADFNDMIDRATRAAFFRSYSPTGSRIVITAGVPFGTPGATNLLHVAWITAYEDRRKQDRPDAD